MEVALEANLAIRGLECGIPETIRESALKLPRSFVLDGERIGDDLHVFDMLAQGEKDLRPLG